MKFSAIIPLGLASMATATALPATSDNIQVIKAIEPVDTPSLTSINGIDAVKRDLVSRDYRGNPICFDRNKYGTNIHRMEYNRYQLSIRTYNEVIAPRVCRRIACDGGAGVALCNDHNSLTYSIDPKLLAQFVYRIWEHCANGEGAGQQFDTRNFNVIIQRMNCGGKQSWKVGEKVP